jgi:hypothetical protein
MTKRVVFAGGVQVKALAKAYRLDVALDYDEDVYFIGAESIAREAAQKVVAAADILITDLTPNGPTVADELIRVGTLRIAVPVVTADFIWPYATGGHPRNTYVTGLSEGPYPAGFGDSYLDRLAAEGVDEEDAIQRYLALDVAQDAQLDDTFAATMATLQYLDSQTGFDIADYIAANFRTNWLFATRDRPNLSLFKHIGVRLYGQMGIAVSRITQLSDTFFPPGAMPIHPAVLAHFGMQVPTADYLYPVLDEGFFSFEQYCRRYWNYDFNRLLHSAIAKAESNPSEAIPELRLALERSPESRAGLRALKDAERAVSDESMLPPLVLAAPPAAAAPPAPAAPPPAKPATLYLASDPPAQPEPEPDVEAEAEPASRVRLPPELTGPTPSPGGLVPRAAFGSSLVRVAKPARPPSRTIDAVAEAPEDPAPSPLRFSTFPAEKDEADALGMAEPMPLTMFQEGPEHLTPLVQLPPDTDPDPVPQPYIELTFGDPPALPLQGNVPATRRAYTPLPPADHLIPLLPKMLPNTRGMAGAVDKAFIDMPETMPPPPLRPVLPPELHPETVKTSLMAKIMDQLRK